MGDNWADVRQRCYTCNGTGSYSGSPGLQVPCPECNGEGYVDTKLQVKIKAITDDLDKIWDKVKNL